MAVPRPPAGEVTLTVRRAVRDRPGVTFGHNNAPVPLHFIPILLGTDNPLESKMRNQIGRRAGRVVLAIALMAPLGGCVVYPAYGPGGYYHHPYAYGGGYYYR